MRPAVSIARRFLSSRRRPECFPLLPAALRVFHERKVHFLVPSTFQVPQHEPQNAATPAWPEDTRGLNLGREIRKFVEDSSRKTSPKLEETRRQLDAIGFPKVHDWKRFQWEQVSLSALKTYKEIYGDMLVNQRFVVPEGDPLWPKPTWGLKLGVHVVTLRCGKQTLHKYQIQDLDDMGFVWVVREYKWDVIFMPALRRHRELYGHCDVPQNFVVGKGEGEGDEWPRHLRGLRLGKMVNRIRAVAAYSEYVDRDIEELEKLGFCLDSSDQRWRETVLPALETYHRIYGHCNIATSFIVPEEDPWPPSAWGIHLGFIARNVRNRGDFPRQVVRDSDRLEQIGFGWSVTAAKWEYEVMPALTTYALTFGNVDIPSDFVVPWEDPWPAGSRGLNLGEMATNVVKRKRFTYFIEMNRVHLEALGFFWSAGTGEDISEAAENDGLEHGCDGVADGSLLAERS